MSTDVCAMSNKIKRDSPLVKSVMALDAHLNELERVGTKINSTDMTSDFDFDYIQKLMTRFAECGQGVSLAPQWLCIQPTEPADSGADTSRIRLGRHSSQRLISRAGSMDGTVR